MPSTDGSWLQDILNKSCGSTSLSLDRASALEPAKYNHFKEVYELDINEWDATSHDAIDVYELWLQLIPAAGAPIDAE